ncbi:MAG: ABC transporter permease [Phycisphaerae bacterium]|nr:ABC transporter permease [Phycisphaerae bacterium]
MNMTAQKNRILLAALRNMPIILFVGLFLCFGVLAPDFFRYQSIENAVKQASYVGIVAVGMAFVLLTGGIDLSVGSNMYLSTVVAGLCIQRFALSPAAAFVICIGAGFTFAMTNAFIVTRLRVVPFIATLATLVAGRGLGRMLSQSRAISFPETITRIGSARLFDVVPYPIVLFALTLLAAWIMLHRTQWGRQIYAVGYNLESARKAGINTVRIRAIAYVVCGVFASFGGFISVAQLGNVNAGFGRGSEFDAIAAAVLGGISLFGGIGSIFPGVLLGAVMIQLVSTGLVSAKVDLYLHSMISALIIFAAVAIDSHRTILLKKMQQRHIRIE